MKDNLSFEMSLKRLEEIINILNNGDISLDESLKLYSESAKLIAFCKTELTTAKLNIEELFPELEQNSEVD